MYPSHQHFHNSEVSWRWLIVMRHEHASTSYRSSIQTAIYKVLAVRSSTLNLPKTRTHRGSDVAIHHFPFRATSQKVLLRPLQFFRAQDEIVPWRTCGTLEWPKGGPTIWEMGSRPIKSQLLMRIFIYKLDSVGLLFSNDAKTWNFQLQFAKRHASALQAISPLTSAHHT